MLLLFLDEQRTLARVVNSTIRNARATIEPLLTNDGLFPVAIVKKLKTRQKTQ
jgi:hypothetical protein